MTTQKIVWQKTRHALAFASLTAVALLSPLSAFAVTPEVQIPDVQIPKPIIHMEKSASPDHLPVGGGKVLYNYFVYNNGNVPLSGTDVVDDKCSPVKYLNGDTDSDKKLDENETWHFSCLMTLTETTTNTATASAHFGEKKVSHTESLTVKVDKEIPPPEQRPGIKVDKTADPSWLPPGGGWVTYTYMVSNTDTVPLSNVGVTDDKCSPVTYVSGDSDSDGKLDKKEVWKFQCKQKLEVTTTNTATVKATWDGGKKVSDTDQATVVVKETPPPPPPPEEKLGIHVQKTASKTSLPPGGDNVTYTYMVSNTGNTTLHNITISDDKCSPISFSGGDVDSDSKLDVGEMWKYTCTMNVKETTTNTVIVKSVQPNDKVVTDTDKATVKVEEDAPAIKVDKSADPTSLPANGGNVTYTYLVSNIGNVPLLDITIDDDKCSPLTFGGGDTDSDGVLDTSETWKYTCTDTITATTTNTATVKGKHKGQTYMDTDKAVVIVNDIQTAPLYKIKVTKSANPVSLPVGGGNVVYSYVIDNQGTAPLNNIVVSDNKCAPVTFVNGDANANGKLDINELWNYTCSMNLTETTTNTVKAQSTNEGATIWDSDKVTVNVGVVPPPPPPPTQDNPGINVIKTASTTTLPAGGGSVTFNYWVGNTGNVALTGVTLTDDKCSPVALQSGDIDSDGKLDTGEIWKYACTMNLSSTTTNVAIASGSAGDKSVTSTAQYTVFVNQPPFQDIRLAFAKSASPTSLPVGGGNVVYTYLVSNPGNTPLQNISITDDKCSPVGFQSGDLNGNGMVEPGEVWVYKCSQFIAQTTINHAIARSFTRGFELIAGDQATVTVATTPPPPPPPAGTPAIHLEKMASPSSLAVGGGAVTYHFAVTNIGNVLLSNIVVTDNKCAPVNYMSGDANSNGWLDFNETWNFTCNASITESVTNIGHVRGLGNGVEVKDTDTATVMVDGATPPPPPPPATGGVTALPSTGEGGATNNGLGMTVSALIAMAAFLGIVGISLFSQEQERKLKR